MARVPYNPVADVTPSLRAPDDYQHIPTNPGEFGGLEAQGKEGLARGAEALGQGASQAGKFFGQVAADDSTNQYMEGVHKTLFGTGAVDPTTGKVDNGYYGLRGKAALDARPGVEAKIEALRNELRGNLLTPEQTLQFDNNTRRIQYFITSEMGRFGDQQADAYAVDVNKTGYQNQLDAVAARPEDDQFATHAALSALSYRTKLAQVTGEANDPEKLRQIRTQTAQDITEARIKALLPTNATAAQKLLDRNQSLLQSSRNYVPLSTAVHERFVQQQGLKIGQDAVTGAADELAKPAAPGGGVPAAPVSINDAILQQESGNRDEAPESANGAVGPGQLEPATFAHYAQPGEDINNPADNRTVANRIVDDLKAKYPNDPARVAVAYFSGEGNVSAPGSITPWVENKKDANGKTVSSYVADITRRVAGAASPASAKAAAYDRVLQTTDDPQVQRQALAYINERYTAASVASLADEKAKKDASDKAADGYVKRVLKGDTGPQIINQIANDPSLTWETRDRLSGIVERHAKSDLARDEKAYGAGFYDLFRAVHAPAGDPSRITDPQQLYQYVGQPGDKGLTVAGLDKLTAEITGRGTPDATAAAVMQRAALDYAKHQLTFSVDNGFMKLRDPHGEDAFDTGFLPAFFQAYQAGIAAGKTPAQLLSKTSPDFIVDKAMAPFMRKPQDKMRDMLQAGLEVPQPPGSPAGTKQPAPDLSTPDALVRAYLEHRISHADAAALAVKNKWIAAPPSPGPQAPLAQ